MRDDGNDSAMDDIEGDDGSTSDQQQNVKLVHHSRGIRAILSTQENNSEMEDLELNYSWRVQPHGKGPISPDKGSGSPLVEELEREDMDAIDDDEKMEGSLPHELRRVLVLESLKSKKNEYEESMIVKRLLSGRRVVHYDPQKGGEIWGVGEDDNDELAEHSGRGAGQEDDDWEGDPVPWEVGELSESLYHTDGL